MLTDRESIDEELESVSEEQDGEEEVRCLVSPISMNRFHGVICTL